MCVTRLNGKSRKVVLCYVQCTGQLKRCISADSSCAFAPAEPSVVQLVPLLNWSIEIVFPFLRFYCVSVLYLGAFCEQLQVLISEWNESNLKLLLLTRSPQVVGRYALSSLFWRFCFCLFPSRRQSKSSHSLICPMNKQRSKGWSCVPVCRYLPIWRQPIMVRLFRGFRPLPLPTCVIHAIFRLGSDVARRAQKSAPGILCFLGFTRPNATKNPHETERQCCEQ